jgi:phage-related minor tail protein
VPAAVESPKQQQPKLLRAAHTGYTLYLQENYEAVVVQRANNNNNNNNNSAAVTEAEVGDNTTSTQQRTAAAKDSILTTLARNWGQLPEPEIRAWQEKADRLKQAAAASATANGGNDGNNGNSNAGIQLAVAESMEELIGLPELPEDGWGSSKKRAARKAPPNVDPTDGSVQV